MVCQPLPKIAPQSFCRNIQNFIYYIGVQLRIFSQSFLILIWESWFVQAVFTKGHYAKCNILYEEILTWTHP